MINIHEDQKLFREAVRFTAAQTLFSARLIEKDYFCTLLLEYLVEHGGKKWAFKGGTCLAKVHAEFYRMSEDLDFTIPIPYSVTRAHRSNEISEVRKAIERLERERRCFHVAEPLYGANESTQYMCSIVYASVLDNQENKITLEVSLREPLVEPKISGTARTILLDPLSNTSMVFPLTLNCISKTEAVAEKFRAAMTRTEAAIRDFYDLDYLALNHDVSYTNPELIELVKHKLAIPGNGAINTDDERFQVLRGQLDTQLKPVLRENDYAKFDLSRAFEFVCKMAQAVR